MFYYLVKALLRPLFSVFFSPRVEGADHIPRRGGVILASNHLSMCDSLFLPTMTRRRVTFLAKIEYFTGRGLKGRAKAAFVRWTGLIPIHREDPTRAAAALRVGISALRSGRVICVYPEGTRSPDGRLYRGKTGVARMALEAGVPVVPVGLIGMVDIQPGGGGIPKIGRRVELRIGKPLDFSRYAGMEGDRFVLRSITDEIMYELMVLSGQEYVDTYATKAKAEIEDAKNAAHEALVSDAPVPARRAS